MTSLNKDQRKVLGNTVCASCLWRRVSRWQKSVKNATLVNTWLHLIGSFTVVSTLLVSISLIRSQSFQLISRTKMVVSSLPFITMTYVMTYYVMNHVLVNINLFV